MTELLTYLTKKLAVERSDAQAMTDLYLGRLGLSFIDPDTKRALGDRVNSLTVNYARLAVDSVASLCQVSGFRTAPGDVADDDLGAIWRATGMDESSRLAQVESLVTGRAYFLAWTGADGQPVITPESASAMTVQRDPITRRITAALKRWRDAEGYSRSLLITADTVAEYASRQATSTDPAFRWEPTMMGEDQLLVREDVNPLGRVPVVALVTRPRIDAPDGESDLTDLADPIKGLTKLHSDQQVASEYGALPRRYAITNAQMTQEQAREVQQIASATTASPAASRMLILGGGADQKLGEWSTAELSNFTGAIELLVGEIAALAALPAYYVNGNHQQPASADAIRASTSRLTARVRERQGWWTPAYAELMRIAQTIRDGFPDPRLDSLDVLWTDPEPRSVAQEADATVKLYAAGLIDRRAALESLDYPPLEVERILTDSDGLPFPETVQTVVRDEAGDMAAVRTYRPRSTVN